MNLLARLTSYANTGVVAVGALAFGVLPVIVTYGGSLGILIPPSLPPASPC